MKIYLSILDFNKIIGRKKNTYKIKGKIWKEELIRIKKEWNNCIEAKVRLTKSKDKNIYIYTGGQIG